MVSDKNGVGNPGKIIKFGGVDNNLKYLEASNIFQNLGVDSRMRGGGRERGGIWVGRDGGNIFHIVKNIHFHVPI